ncbi:RDD family protein [Kitasatospora sp. CM 4170]|uniref:RDD family protein n=1 Tax=Kitasatospora aburaviensis TaxID=67265 RepID=A0ABW1F7T4_9ACTN|nr:RDD family protein [Kitasatospora sp. CM 4170]WNM46051.1 RDD family protein [Kitasatospora sp. CM 4170]
MSDLVTGEAVVLGLRTAKLPSRALAIGLDLTVELAALLVCTLTLSVALVDLDPAALAALMIGLTVFFMVAVPIMVETFTRGRSLGKAALGLRVVRTDGGPVRFRHALVRALVGFFEIIVLSGVPAAICSAVSADGRRLGDVFAGTLVVRERVPGGSGAAAALPPVHPQLLQAIGGELVALDLSAVPEPLWLAIRQLLGRVGQLDPAVAHQMSARLADDLAARTGHPVPYGLHPAAYLGAVLTERQRREWTRAQSQAFQQAQAHPQAHPLVQPVLQAPVAPGSQPGPTPAIPQIPQIPQAPAQTPPTAAQAPAAPPAPTPQPGAGRTTGPAAAPTSSTGFVPPA